MPSWVRFSVAVYLGLLLAGAVIAPEPIVADTDELTPPPVRLPWPDRPEPGENRGDERSANPSHVAPTRD